MTAGINGSLGLESLVPRQRPGFALEQPFYRDKAIFE